MKSTLLILMAGGLLACDAPSANPLPMASSDVTAAAGCMRAPWVLTLEVRSKTPDVTELVVLVDGARPPPMDMMVQVALPGGLTTAATLVDTVKAAGPMPYRRVLELRGPEALLPHVVVTADVETTAMGWHARKSPLETRETEPLLPMEDRGARALQALRSPRAP
jgi:hypothetical protein